MQRQKEREGRGVQAQLSPGTSSPQPCGQRGHRGGTAAQVSWVFA